MANNNIVKYNTRVQLKYDSLTNWNAVATTFTPLKGEVCVVNPSENLGSGSTTVLFKVGDGERTFAQLPYLSAVAADVYGWAKAASVILENETLEFRTAESQVIYSVDLGTFATDEELANLEERVEALEGTVTNLGETVSQIPGNINNAVNALGNSLATGTGGTLKTITDIAYSENNHTATVTYDDIQEATTTQKGVVQLSDSTSSNESTTAATSKAVKSAYDLASGASADAAAAQQAAEAAQGTADNALATANNNKTAIEAMDLDEVKGDDAYTYIKSITQTNGKVTATTGVIPDGSTSDKGVVKLGVTDGAATYARVEELASEIVSINNKITNAMHFLGSTTTAISDGATTATILIGGENKTLTAADAGAVVLYGGYEYVWVGNAWEQLGQEGSFAVKGSIENSDIKDNAGIAQTKIASTLGKANLAGDISDLNTRLGTAEGDINSLEGAVANHKSYATVKDGATGTTTAETINDELSIVGDGKITTTVTKDTVTINHAVAGTAAQTIGSATAATPAHGAAFNVIGQVKYDATGHIVGVDEKTVTLPAGYDDSPVIALENTTWKTSTNIKTVTTDATSTQKGALAASDLTIGETEIGYIIFDCGSSTINI